MGRKMKNNYKLYSVRYWDIPTRGQGGTVNQCFGNSLLWTGKARTEEEAVRKAGKEIKNFTIHSVNYEKAN